MKNLLWEMPEIGEPACACSGCDADSHHDHGHCTSRYQENPTEWRHATAQDGLYYTTCPKCLKARGLTNDQ